MRQPKEELKKGKATAPQDPRIRRNSHSLSDLPNGRIPATRRVTNAITQRLEALERAQEES